MQEGGYVKAKAMQDRGPTVPETAKHEPDSQAPIGLRSKGSWVEASIRPVRMLAALGNGVQGGK